MSETLFGRKVAVRFGVPGEMGRAFTDLRVRFTVEKTSEPTPNKCRVDIYNLTESSRSLGERNGLVLVLSAGYGGNIEDLFSGDIAQVITSLEGSDFVTSFEAGDGEKAYKLARLDTSFAAGANVKDIFTKAIDAMGLAVGDISGVLSKTILNGMSLSGLARKHLDDLTAENNLEWSIQDGAVQIIEANGRSNGESVLLTKGTGLIGIPKKKNEGIECVSLLQPKLKPGAMFQIKSRFITGDFRAVKVTHNGDTHGNEWFSVVEAIEL